VGTGKRRVHGIGSGGIDNPRIALVDRPDIAHYADEWDLGAALVARGFGVALVPRWAQLPSDYPIVRIPLSEQPAPMRHILGAVRAGSSYQPVIAAGLDALREIAARKREDAAVGVDAGS